MTSIKICGLKRLEDVEYVNEVLPEYAGFVFWDKSKRNVDFDFALELRRAMDRRIASVGVFVDRPVEDILELAERKIISLVQLHGHEDSAIIKQLRDKLPGEVRIIKAFEINSEEDIKKANESIADMVLIDSGKGSGKVFDWELLKLINRPYFLAGGLSAENVRQAIDQYRPYAVDVSSKVETDGCKDKQKIISFVNAVRADK